MRKFVLIFLLILGNSIFAQDSLKLRADLKLRTDGPYFQYSNDSVREIRIDSNGTIFTKSYLKKSIKSFPVISDDNLIKFTVKFHSFKRLNSRINSPAKIFVISDIHSNLADFLSILKIAGVIDNRLNWTFKTNHLVVLGDVADRGKDATTIFWLIYRLEEQARRKGGMVHFLLGNHERMVMQNDLRYTDKKYLNIASALSVNLNEFYGNDTELGRWLRSKNSIQIIGENLFVHGGLSREFAVRYSNLDFVNSTISSIIDRPKKEIDPQNLFLVDSNGPIWYRGLVLEEERYLPAKEEDVDYILAKFNVTRIIVGHTTMKKTTFNYSGKVVAIDQESGKMDHLASGILIEKGKVVVIENYK